MTLVSEKFLSVGGYPTFVTQCGNLDADTDTIALVIPGNPGVADYYNEYIEVLYEACGRSMPVWSLSHAGQVKPPHSASKQDFYHLRGQIEHKLQFIKEHIPENTKVILIGHSIGCYIILHMLEQIPRDRVITCPLLFLTVERMALSPKGKVVTPMLKYFRWMIPYLMVPINLIPQSIATRLLQWYFKDRPIHQGAITATSRLANSYSLRNVTNMANEEMRHVDIPDYHLLQRHRHKLWFYYGAKDHWCPLDYYYDMKRRYPDADITLCEHGFEHAFCLESSREMAELTWKKIGPLLQNQ